MNKLQGNILTLPKMSGSVSTPKSLIGNVGAKTINIGVEPDYYEGTYEVTPNTKQQVLLTEQKTLQENIIVNSVPYAEVSNTSNGTTITIGK